MNVVISQDEHVHLKEKELQLEVMFKAGVETWEEYDYYKFLLKNKKTHKTMNTQSNNNSNSVFVNERDLRIMYNVDMLSTYQIADKLGVDVKQIRNALKNIGVIVRRGEVETIENNLRLIVNRIDNSYMNSDGTPYVAPTVETAVFNETTSTPSWS
jgi:UDP-N-acetylmuramyl pentapeptide synthase